MNSSSTKKQTKPEDVLKYTKPTKGFLCDLEDNTLGIQFQRFMIRDVNSGESIFDTNVDAPAPFTEEEANDPNNVRMIKYNFNKKMLTTKQIGTTLVFSIGNEPIRNFRMVERHYVGDKLLRSFDYTLPFIVPNSTNSWECIYDVPKLTSKELKEVLDSPFKTQSDSFYFVNDGQLVMHNKAFYHYH